MVSPRRIEFPFKDVSLRDDVSTFSVMVGEMDRESLAAAKNCISRTTGTRRRPFVNKLPSRISAARDSSKNSRRGFPRPVIRRKTPVADFRGP